MSQPEEPRVTRKSLIITAVATALAVVLYFQFNRRQSDEEVPLLHTYQDFQQTSAEVRELVMGPFQKFDGSQGLSMNDEAALRKAQQKVRGIILYDPEFDGYFLAGKIAYTLGDNLEAIKQFNLCVASPKSADAGQEFYVQTRAEAQYLTALALFNLGRYSESADNARLAAQAVPQSALYLWAEAQAYVELHADTTAIKLCQEALKIDPANAKAKALLDFIAKNPSKQSG